MCNETESKLKWVYKVNNLVLRLFCGITTSWFSYVMLCPNLMTVQMRYDFLIHKEFERLKHYSTKVAVIKVTTRYKKQHQI